MAERLPYTVLLYAHQLKSYNTSNYHQREGLTRWLVSKRPAGRGNRTATTFRIDCFSRRLHSRPKQVVPSCLSVSRLPTTAAMYHIALHQVQHRYHLTCGTLEAQVYTRTDSLFMITAVRYEYIQVLIGCSLLLLYTSIIIVM